MGIQLNGTSGTDVISAVDGSLTIDGDISVVDKIIHGGDTNTAIRFPSADTITAETGGSSRFKIDSSGNVTIGNDGDSGSGPSVGYDELCIEGGNEDIGMCFLSPAANNVTHQISFGDSNNNQAGRIIYNHASDYMALHANSDERLRITSAGLVGIGTDAPGSMLHLVSASSPTLRLQDTTNNCLTLLFSQNSNAHLGTFSAHPLIFDTNSISRIKINTATGSNNAEIKFSTNDSSTDYLKWGNNPRLWLRCPDGINGLRIDANTTPFELRSSDATGRSIGVGGGANFDMSFSGDYSLSSGGHDSSPRIFLNATRHNGSTTVTSFQTSIQAVSLSNNNNDGYLGLGASASPDDINILTNGKVFIGPYSAGDDFSDAGSFLNLKNNSYGGRIAFSNATATANNALMEQFAYWGNNKVAGIIATSGGDTTNKDDGELRFYTRHSGQGAGLRVRITRHGAVCFGVQDHANNALDSISGFSGTRNVNILSFPTAVSPWSSWVGTNLYHDGTNFVKHSDHLGQNWGNIAGIKFDGANHGGAIGMRFVVDLPQGNAGGDISIGSAVSAVDNKSAMNIYATGQITKPKHCSFNYGGNGDLSLSSGDTIASWRNNGTQCYELGTKSDGGSYLSSGVFTAPVTGAYFFTATILLKGVTNSTDSVHVYWKKNSSAYHYFNTRFHGETSQGSGMGYGGYVPVIGACTMYLTAGDTCRIAISYSGSGIGQYAPQNDGWTNWSGFLIG